MHFIKDKHETSPKNIFLKKLVSIKLNLYICDTNHKKHAYEER